MRYTGAMNERRYRYTVLIETAAEGGYTITCPSLPGLVTEGDTLAEARRMAAEAIRGYLYRLAKGGLPIPPDDPALYNDAVAETIAGALKMAW